jgi:hypothetical protein
MLHCHMRHPVAAPLGREALAHALACQMGRRRKEPPCFGARKRALTNGSLTR